MKQKIRKQVTVTIKHIKSALRQLEHHEDAQVRHSAKKLLKSIPHVKYSELARRASSFCGRVKKSSHRLNEQQLRKNSRTLDISKSMKLQEVRSLDFLQEVGRRLENCVARRCFAQTYLQEVRDGYHELWAVYKWRRMVGLLNVETWMSHISDRVVRECSAKRRLPLELSREEAFKVLKSLSITDVEAETFVRVGAFPMFLRKDKEHAVPLSIYYGTKSHRVWQFSDRIVVGTTDTQSDEPAVWDPTKVKWSQFKLVSTDEWETLDEEEDTENELNQWVEMGSNNYLTTGNLLQIVVSQINLKQIIQ
ncbi:MAG: hypothetical protein F4Y65_05800 [Gammaproteobacteria bacterium]|nr:hypothetical protein [Gammaproteobacteria bacterium]